MNVFDKAKDKAEQLIGGAKEEIGKLTGNEQMQKEGKTDQVTGEAKEGMHNLRDKGEELANQAGAAVKEAKDKLTGGNS